MMEEFTKGEKRFVLKCKECGHLFLPWKALMVTKKENNMRPYVYCPNCGKCDDMDNFKLI